MSSVTPFSSSYDGRQRSSPTVSDEFIMSIIEDMVTKQNVNLNDKKSFEKKLSEQVKTKCVKKNAPAGVAKLKNFSAFDAKLRMRSLVKKGFMTPQYISSTSKNNESLNNNSGMSDAQSFRTNSTISYGAVSSGGSGSRNSHFSGPQSSGSYEAGIASSTKANNYSLRRHNSLRSAAAHSPTSSLSTSSRLSSRSKNERSLSFSKSVPSSLSSSQKHRNSTFSVTRANNYKEKNNDHRVLKDISPSDSFDAPAIRYGGKKDVTIKKINFEDALEQEQGNIEDVSDNDVSGDINLNNAKRQRISGVRNSLRSVGKSDGGVSQLLSSKKTKKNDNNVDVMDGNTPTQYYEGSKSRNDPTITTTAAARGSANSSIRKNFPFTNMNVNLLNNRNNNSIILPQQQVKRTIFRPQHPLFKPFRRCQSTLRKKLSQAYLPESKTLIGIDKQRLEVKRVLERTLSDAENNSVLLVGARGGGKSLIMKHVLNSMKKKFISTPKRKKKSSSSKKKSSSSESSSRRSILVDDLIAEDPVLSAKKRSISSTSSSSSSSSRSVLTDSSSINRHPRRPLVLHSPRSESNNRNKPLHLPNSSDIRKTRKRNKRSRIVNPRIYLMGSIKNDGMDFNRIVKKFNGNLSSTMTSSVTHIILQNHKIERTPELLENLAKPVLDNPGRRSSRPAYIVSEEWLYANVTAGYPVDETGYEPEDQIFEQKYGISIATAIARRKNVAGLLSHTAVWISPSVKPGRTDLRRMIANAGGILLNSLPKPNSYTRNGFIQLPSRNSLADLSPLSPIAGSSRVNNKRLLVISTKADLENDHASSIQGGSALGQESIYSGDNASSSDNKIIHNGITKRLKALGVGYIYKVEVLLDAILKHQITLNDQSFMLMTLRTNGEIYPHSNQIIPSPKSKSTAFDEDHSVVENNNIESSQDESGNEKDKDGLSKYERDRLKRIRGNQEFLATLGLTSVRRDIADAMGKPPSPKEVDAVDADDGDSEGNKEREEEGQSLDDDVMMMDEYNNVGQLSSTAPFVVIRLNGMAHADEKVALREISRQLFLEYESYKIGSRSLSFAHHLQLLLDVLREAKGVSVPMVFILDEFQEFATRNKQTLLYTLLDILQSGETQMAVVGLTEKIDVVESLEKRIQSRFSHRQIFIPPIAFDDKMKVLKSRLLLPQTFMQSNTNNKQMKKGRHKNNKRKRSTRAVSSANTVATTTSGNASTSDIISFSKRWNDEIKLLFQNRLFRDLFKKYHNYGHSMKWFLNATTVALSKLNFVNNERQSYAPPFLDTSHFEAACAEYCVDRRELSFNSLNVVEMLLLISMAHLEKCNSIPYNFESIYEEYCRLLRLEDEGGSIGVSTYTFTKKIMFKAFEQVLALGLCKAVGAGSKTLFNGVMAAQSARVNQYDLHYQAVRLILDLKHLKDLFRLDNANLPTLVKTWTQKWI